MKNLAFRVWVFTSAWPLAMAAIVWGSSCGLTSTTQGENERVIVGSESVSEGSPDGVITLPGQVGEVDKASGNGSGSGSGGSTADDDDDTSSSGSGSSTSDDDDDNSASGTNSGGTGSNGGGSGSTNSGSGGSTSDDDDDNSASGTNSGGTGSNGGGSGSTNSGSGGSTSDDDDDNSASGTNSGGTGSNGGGSGSTNSGSGGSTSDDDDDNTNSGGTGSSGGGSNGGSSSGGGSSGGGSEGGGSSGGGLSGGSSSGGSSSGGSSSGGSSSGGYNDDDDDIRPVLPKPTCNVSLSGVKRSPWTTEDTLFGTWTSTHATSCRWWFDGAYVGQIACSGQTTWPGGTNSAGRHSVRLRAVGPGGSTDCQLRFTLQAVAPPAGSGNDCRQPDSRSGFFKVEGRRGTMYRGGNTWCQCSRDKSVPAERVFCSMPRGISVQGTNLGVCSGC